MVVRWLVLGALLGCSSACETGVAFEHNVLSVTRSLMANADVALLKNFTADSLKHCMEQCCTGRYGSCSVASFKSNSTSGNCLHFYCRPLTKCKFQPSDGIDSFSFSSNPTPSSTTPDDDHKNSTVKPRKGVDDTTKSSGIKPRKGVNLDDAPEAKSNVKARKGVEEGPPATPHTSSTTSDDIMADLAKILADDSVATTTTTESPIVSPTSTIKIPSYSSDSTSTNQKTLEVSSSTTTQKAISTTRTPPLKTYSEANRRLEASPKTFSEANHHLEASESEANRRLEASPKTFSKSEAYHHLEASSKTFSESEANHRLEASPNNEEEEENDRRYKSSIHLILSLVFGLLVLFAVLGVVAKRVYDGWLRRDYYRMNYLIDGIYNAAD